MCITMAYLHYTCYPIDKLSNIRTQVQNYIKPFGIWLSQGEEWAEWCDREGFETDTCYIYSVNIKKDTLITISSFEELETFQKTYEGPYGIQWEKVAKDYDGICFEKYYDLKGNYLVRSQSVKGIWILGIDINSVCIWNPSNVIIDWTLIRERVDNTHIDHLTELFTQDVYKVVHGVVDPIRN